MYMYIHEILNGYRNIPVGKLTWQKQILHFRDTSTHSWIEHKFIKNRQTHPPKNPAKMILELIDTVFWVQIEK